MRQILDGERHETQEYLLPMFFGFFFSLRTFQERTGHLPSDDLYLDLTLIKVHGIKLQLNTFSNNTNNNANTVSSCVLGKSFAVMTELELV